jgi:signal transduction histidine kinase
MIPSLFPIFEGDTGTLHDGTEIPLSDVCKESIFGNAKCIAHYEQIMSEGETKRSAYVECPLGFTSRVFTYENKSYVMTGVIATPRFGSESERTMAKKCSSIYRISRQSIENNIQYLKSLESLRADIIEDASQVLPQAFHELRKLNGAVIQHAEHELKKGESRSLLSIKAAAELMKNNFDLLEALSNIEGIKALPIDSTINLFDLAFKLKRVFQEKIEERGLSLYVDGDRAIINGSQKSFPIVPAVLFENAIKYAKRDSQIDVQVITNGTMAVLLVRNLTNEKIHPTKCFERGVRFSKGVEGGGYGLYLAREVVRCHGGHISCKAEGDVVEMVVEFPVTATIPHKFQ